MDAPMNRGDERAGGMRILVVDDCRDTARMMRVLLKGQGHEVTLASTGAEALRLAETVRPDVVLLDLTLPDTRGEDVAEQLSRAEGFEATTFVAISGYGTDRVPPVFHGQFVKPVEHDALNAFLAQVASGRGTPR
jgi:CheY-like chemotaxis protein